MLKRLALGCCMIVGCNTFSSLDGPGSSNNSNNTNNTNNANNSNNANNTNNANNSNNANNTNNTNNTVPMVVFDPTVDDDTFIAFTGDVGPLENLSFTRDYDGGFVLSGRYADEAQPRILIYNEADQADGQIDTGLWNGHDGPTLLIGPSAVADLTAHSLALQKGSMGAIYAYQTDGTDSGLVVGDLASPTIPLGRFVANLPYLAGASGFHEDRKDTQAPYRNLIVAEDSIVRLIDRSQRSWSSQDLGILGSTSGAMGRLITTRGPLAMFIDANQRVTFDPDLSDNAPSLGSEFVSFQTNNPGYQIGLAYLGLHGGGEHEYGVAEFNAGVLEVSVRSGLDLAPIVDADLSYDVPNTGTILFLDVVSYFDEDDENDNNNPANFVVVSVERDSNAGGEPQFVAFRPFVVTNDAINPIGCRRYLIPPDITKVEMEADGYVVSNSDDLLVAAGTIFHSGDPRIAGAGMDGMIWRNLVQPDETLIGAVEALGGIYDDACQDCNPFDDTTLGICVPVDGN